MKFLVKNRIVYWQYLVRRSRLFPLIAIETKGSLGLWSVCITR